ncbi:WXG100 family type VII secretion target [Saccharothrix xinjiangensis]|uniref:WXG100 family type VII secretion target n=1 Tax=Saccharothrix xinjiangensis TaxID=204798 RepID=A0ABV9YBV1_9PSEU
MSPSTTVEVNNKIETFLNGCPGPVQGVIRPLLTPFLEAIDWVAGDPDDLIRAADAWEKAATDIRAIVSDEASARQAVTGVWQGPAADSFNSKLSEIEEQVDQLAQNVQDTSGMLVEAAKGCVDAANLIIDLVIDLIMLLVSDLLVSLSLSVISFGASLAAGAAAAAAKAAITLGKVMKIVKKLADLLMKLSKLLRKLADGAKKYKKGLQEIKERKKKAGSFSEKVSIGIEKSIYTAPVRIPLGQVIGESVPGGPAGAAINAGKDVYNYATDDN